MMKSRRDEKISESSGQALVELVLVLTLLTLLTMGVVDFARVIQANNIITDMSREGADLAARGGLTGTQATKDAKIMNALAYTAQPLKMVSNGMMYVSVVTKQGANFNIVKDTWGGSSLDPATLPSRVVATNPVSPIVLADGDVAYIVEVFYKYQSIFSSNTAKITPVLYSKAIF